MSTHSPLDLRTRFDGATPTSDAVRALDTELPELLATSPMVESAAHLDLRPLQITIGDRSWCLERTDGCTSVTAVAPRTDASTGSGKSTDDPGAPVELNTDEATFAALLDDQITPIGMMTAGALDLRNGGIGHLLDWWLILRSVLDHQPVHHRGSTDTPGDLGQSFTLDDDPELIREFLTHAGFVVLRGVYSADEMRAISADMDSAAGSYRPGDGNSWWARTSAGDERIVRMQRFDEKSPATADLLGDGRLEQIRTMGASGHVLDGGIASDGHALGPNRIEALTKPIGVTEGISDVPWHKDCSLGRHSYRCCSMTVGVSVTGAGAGSGQLRVVAGSHRALVWPSLLDVGSTGLPELALATSTGDVTVHLSCTLHMAEPPSVEERRVLYTSFGLPAHDPVATARAERELTRSRELAPVNVSQ